MRATPLSLVVLLLAAPSVAAQQGAEVTVVQPSALAEELSVLEPILGTWEGKGEGFRSQLVYRVGVTGRVIQATNFLFNESGDEIGRYEGSYFWSPEFDQLRFQTISDGGELHSGYLEPGDVIWHVAKVYGSAIDGYRSTFSLVGPNTLEYRAIYRADATSSDVLAGDPITYLRLEGPTLEASDLPFDPPAPQPTIARLGELEGEWRACSRQPLRI